MQKFIDTYGDTVEVEADVALGTVYISTPEGRDDYAFTPERATALAHAILEEAGADAPVSRAQVSAKALTFNEGVVRLAAIHGKTVEFRYVKSDTAAPETRRLVPSGVVGQGEHLRFTGHDPDRDATRAFRLDRIKGDVGVIA